MSAGPSRERRAGERPAEAETGIMRTYRRRRRRTTALTIGIPRATSRKPIRYETVRIMFSPVTLDLLERMERNMVTKDDLRTSLEKIVGEFVASIECGASSPEAVMNVASTMVSSIASPPICSTSAPGSRLRQCQCGVMVQEFTLYPGSADPMPCPKCGRVS